MTLYKATADGQVPMTPEEEAEFLASRTPSITIPQEVTMRQARQALILAGKLSAVNAALAGMTGTAGELARAEWEYSITVQRNRPLVLSLGPALGMTSGDLDQLFITAAAL